jgi:hypothetical protein
MGAMIVRHSVRDFAAWRPVYDAHEAARTAAGLTNGRVFRSTEGPNDVLLLFDIADRRRAEEFGAGTEATVGRAWSGAGRHGGPEEARLPGPVRRGRPHRISGPSR